MARRIGILTVHAMGDQTPDFDSDLRKGLLARLDAEARRDIRFKGIYYQDLLQVQQEAILERMKPSKLRWRGTRRFFMQSFSDATTYQYRSTYKSSVYSKVHNRIRDLVDELSKELGSEECPLVIIAQSLGCHVISNYIWDAQRARAIWKDQPPTEFQKLGTTEHMLTTGCNIPFFVSGFDDIQAITPPNGRFRWTNFYDRDDVLGWPLKPLKHAAAN